MMQQRKLGLLVFALFCLVISAAPLAFAAWPRFRGPNGEGKSTNQIPIAWNEKNVLWKTAIPGVGNSSPIVWGKRIFLQSASADGKERTLFCLSADDGKIFWAQSAAGTRAHMHQRNTLASSTPATDGERVYALFWDGTDVSVHAYDFGGKPLWSRDLGPFKSQHGAGTSPVVYRDKVFLANDQDGTSTLFALDAATGKIAWQVPRKAFRACYSAPFLLERSGHASELIVASSAGITSYDPDTGTENWNWTWPWSPSDEVLRTVSSPVYGQGLILANSGQGGPGRRTVAVKVGSKGDKESAQLVWENNRPRLLPYVPTMLARGDYFYWVNDQGIAGCALARTGEIVWTERLGSPVTASPVLISGNIYAISENGQVYVFAADPRFKLLAKNSIDEPVMASPAIAGDRLFIRGRSHLFCIGTPAE